MTSIQSSQSSLIDSFLDPYEENDTNHSLHSENCEDICKNAIENIYKLIILSLQNAINSSTHAQHNHNSKSTVPFLFNQTIKKLDEYIGTENNLDLEFIKCLEKISYLNDGLHIKHVVQSFYDTMMMLAKKYEFIVKPAVIESWSRNTNTRDQGIALSGSHNHTTENNDVQDLTDDETKFLYLLHFINNRLHLDQSNSATTSSNLFGENHSQLGSNYGSSRAKLYHRPNTKFNDGRKTSHNSFEDDSGSTYGILMLRLLLASCLSLVTEASHSAMYLYGTAKEIEGDTNKSGIENHKSVEGSIDSIRLLVNTQALLSKSQHQLCSQIMACCVSLLSQFPNDIKSLCSEYTLHSISEQYAPSPVHTSRDQASPTAATAAIALDKRRIISTLFQLQSVISTISHVASSHRPIHPHASPGSSHSHPQSQSLSQTRGSHARTLSNPQQPTVFPSLGLDAIFWFQQVQAELAPFQRLLAFSIRTATVVVSLGCRPDVTLAVLTNNPGVRPAGSAAVTTAGASGSHSFANKYFHNVNRAIAIQLLHTQPMGAFLLRPHEGDPELLYLSFHGTADEGVKHAIIRKEKVAKADDETAAAAGVAGGGNDDDEELIVYKCGKIGPSRSIDELLTWIAMVLPSSLRFDVIMDSSRDDGLMPAAASKVSPTSSVAHSLHSHASAAAAASTVTNKPTDLLPIFTFDMNSGMWKVVHETLLNTTCRQVTFQQQLKQRNSSQEAKSANGRLKVNTKTSVPPQQQQQHMTHDELKSLAAKVGIAQLSECLVAALSLNAMCEQFVLLPHHSATRSSSGTDITHQHLDQPTRVSQQQGEPSVTAAGGSGSPMTSPTGYLQQQQQQQQDSLYTYVCRSIDELLRHRRRVYQQQEADYNIALLRSSSPAASSVTPFGGSSTSHPIVPTTTTSSSSQAASSAIHGMLKRPSLSHASSSYPVSKSPDFFMNDDDLNSVTDNDSPSFLSNKSSSSSATAAAAQYCEPDNLFLKVFEYFQSFASLSELSLKGHIEDCASHHAGDPLSQTLELLVETTEPTSTAVNRNTDSGTCNTTQRAVTPRAVTDSRDNSPSPTFEHSGVCVVAQPTAPAPSLPAHMQCAESLIVQLFRVVPNKMVRFPGSGCGMAADHRVQCLEATELISTLGKIIKQYNALRDASLNLNNLPHAPSLSSIAAIPPPPSQSQVKFAQQPVDSGSSSSSGSTSKPSKQPSHGVKKSTSFDSQLRKAHAMVDSLIHRVSSSTGHSHSAVLEAMHISRSHANLSSSSSSDSVSSVGSDKFSRESILQRDEELLVQLLLTATPFVRTLFYTKHSAKHQTADDSAPPPPSPGTAALLHWATGDSGSGGGYIEHLNKQLSFKSVMSDAESACGEPSALLSPAEYLTWLMEEEVMQSVSKQPDTAFHGARLYYRYRDPWEVHVSTMDEHGRFTSDMSDGEFKRFGRQRFASLTNSAAVAGSSSGSYAVPPSKLTCRASSVAGAGDGSSGSYSEVLRPLLGLYHYAKSTSYYSGSTAYSSSSIAAKTASPHVSVQPLEGDSFDDCLNRLWSTLRAEQWLVSTVSTARVETSADTGASTATAALLSKSTSQSHSRIWRTSSGNEEETYLWCLSRHMIRNCVFAQLGLPQRFTVSLQTDIFGFKEIGGRDNSFSLSSALTTGLELYAVICLARTPTLLSGLKLSANAHHVSKAPPDGSAVTRSSRAEIVKSPGGSHGTEYAWRERLKFNFCFPEELQSITDSTELIHLLDPATSATRDPLVTADHKTMMMSPNSSSVFTSPIPSTHLANPPQYLLASVYERSFFADTKLGELQLPLSTLTLNRPYRGWVPLVPPHTAGTDTSSRASLSSNTATGANAASSSNASTWFIHLQLQLKFPMKVIEQIHAVKSNRSNSMNAMDSVTPRSAAAAGAGTDSLKSRFGAGITAAGTQHQQQQKSYISSMNELF